MVIAVDSRTYRPADRSGRLRGRGIGPLARGVAALCAVLATAVPAIGQEVEARLVPSRVTVGETAELVVVVTGGSLGLDVDAPTLPSSSGVEIVGSRRSSEVRLSGTDVTRRVVYRYTLRPRAPGSHRIGPIRVRVDGVVHQTGSRRLVVVDAPGVAASEAPRGGSPPALFAVTRVDRGVVWAGEQLTLTFAFYHDPRVPLGESPDYDPPDTPGFWRVELDDRPAVDVERIGGRTYHVQQFRYALFPLRPGELTIGPATVRVVEPDADRWWTPGRKRAIETEPLDVVVRELPAGAPPTFEGAVGRFRLEGALQRRRAPVGTPLELELVVEGTGNPTAVPPPELPAWPEVTVGSPNVEATTEIRDHTVAGRTTFRFLLTPRERGDLDLGSARLAYFDPQRGRYAVDTLRLGEIHVEPGTALAAEASPEEGGPTLWEARDPRLPGPRGWTSSPWYWLALAGPWAGWLLLLGASRVRSAASPIGAEAGRPRARLAEARRGLRDGAPGATTLAVAAVRDAIAARWGADLAEADPAELRSALRAEGVDPARIDVVTEARRRTVAAAYAGASPQRAADAVERLERALRSEKAKGRYGGVGVLVALLLAGVATLDGAAREISPRERWEAANQAYREGDFDTALALYDQLGEVTPDPRLEADRAAALWRSGREGLAVAAYLRSIDLAPRAWRVRADLADLRADLGDPPGHDPSGPRFLEYVRLDEWLAGLLFLSWGAFAAALIGPRSRAGEAGARVLVAGFVILAGLAGVDAAASTETLGVVRAEATIRARPAGPTIATAPEGAVATLLERSDRGWRVRVGELPAGWVATDRIVPLH
ncbi:MAG: BatD family protein [Gemmatimonadota bacterium]|nr:BatD family protein [Gemmatimonadota bacterium]